MPEISSTPKIFGLGRPHARLLTYYSLTSLATGPFFPIVFLFGLIRFRTLRYRFDDEGIAMTWGALFQREVHLTYDRIQDIHLTSNALERWLGLAKIQIQTASGAAKAEMTIEGLREFAEIRNFLYTRMRGARGEQGPGAGDRHASSENGTASRTTNLAGLHGTLLEIADELRRIRETLESEQREARGRGSTGNPATGSSTPEETLP